MSEHNNLPDLELNQQPTAPALPDLDLPELAIDSPELANMPRAEQPGWLESIGASLTSMPERMQKSWEGIKQGISIGAANTQEGTLAMKVQDAVKNGDTDYLASLGVTADDITPAPGDDYATKLAKNQKLYGAIEQAKIQTLQNDKDFMESRDKSLKLAAEIAKTAPPDDEKWSAKNLLSTIATGAVDMAPAVLTSIIFKSPTAGLAEMTGQAYGSYMQDALDKGLTPGQAQERASLFAALEPLTESIPLGLLLKKGANSLTDLGKTAVAEGLQEGTTQAIQDAYDVGRLNEDMTVGQFLENMGHSAVVGAGVGGTLHGAVHAPGMVKEYRDNRAVQGAVDTAAAESGQAAPTIDPGEYDAVAAEMGGTDALDRMTEQVVPEISAARRQAYTEARARGLSPADAMTEARGADTGADMLDQMVQDVFDSPDSIYYANKQSAVNPPQSVADMVATAVAGGDIGPVTGETLGLPSPGQTSVIAMPGPVAEQQAPTPQQQFTPPLLQEIALPPTPKAVIAELPPLPEFETKAELPPVPKAAVTELPPVPKAAVAELPTVPKAAVAELPPLPEIEPVVETKAAELPPVPSAAEKIFGKRRRQQVIDNTPSAEEVAAENERQAEMLSKGNEAVARMEQRAELPPLPGKKPAPMKVTKELTAAAKERGVEPGAKVNWNGKEYDVDKLQGRAVRLVDENGNGHIADIREVNAPQTEAAPVQTEAAPVQTEAAPVQTEAAPVTDENGMATFGPETKTKGIPRAEMPQIKAEHRGALANFLKSKGITSTEETVPADKLKPTQAEYEPAKIANMVKEGIDTNRAILVSKDGHVIDGHHQWMAAKEKGEDIRVIRLGAPIGKALKVAHEFPSSTVEAPAAASPKQTVPEEGTPLSKPVATSSKARHTFTEPPAPKGDVTNPKSPAYREETDRAYRKSWLEGKKPEKIGHGGFELRRVDNTTPSDLRGDEKNKFLVTKGDTTWAYPTRVAAQAGMHEMRGAELEEQAAKAKAKPEETADEMIGQKVTLEGTEYTITGKDRENYVAKADGKPMEVLEPAYAKRLAAKKAPSIKPETKGENMTPEEVAEVAVEFRKRFKGVESVDMVVLNDAADLGINLPEGKSMLGFYDVGKIETKLFSNKLKSKEDVEALLRHELIVHYGLRARLSKPEYDAEMDKVLAAENSPALRQYFQDAREAYSDYYDLTTPDGQRMIAEEVVAAVAENPQALEKSGVIRRVLEAIRQLLIKAKILTNKASMESVHDLIKANAKYLKDTVIDRNDVRVSMPEMTYQAPPDIAPMMKKNTTDIEDAAVPDDIKEGMRNTMYRDNRSMTERVKDWVNDRISWSGMYQGLFDDMHSIELLERKKHGALLPGRESAYKMAMLAKNMNSIIAVAMNKGAPKYENGAVTVAPGTKGFTEIFKPVMELKGNMLPVWEYWAGAVRAKRLLAEGREQLYTQKQIDDIIDFVNRRPEMRKAFNQAHKDWRALNKAVLDFGEATGIVDPEARKLFESDDYVPFYRVDEEAEKVTGPQGKRSLANQSSGIRRLKGGEGKMDILENMGRNVQHIIQSGYKNAVMQRVHDVAIDAAMTAVPSNFKPVGISNDAIKKALNDMGVATSGMSKEQMAGYTNLFTAVAPAGPNIITIRYDGKPKYFEVEDPQLLRSLVAIGPERIDMWLKILSVPKKVLTRLTTSTPTFIATNMVRDVAGNFVQLANETGRNNASTIVKDVLTLRPVYKAMQGFLRSVTNHGIVTEYQVSGGMSGGYDQSRPEAVAQHLRMLNKRNVILDTPKKLWEVYDKFLTASEQATRLSVYQDVLDNTGDPMEAAYQANDVMNFSRRGDSFLMNVAVHAIPFLNARVQGLDRMYRGGRDNRKAFLLKGTILLGFTMGLMAMNADDEDYWALPEYERDNFWVIPVNGTRFRIPKPFEIGAVFGTIPERIVEQTIRKDDVLGDRMGFLLKNTFAFDWRPQLIKPMMEVGENLNSFTDRPVVPFALQHVQPEQQYSTTTPEWIKWLAESMPDSAPEVMRSPLKLQHLIQGYTGSMGTFMVASSDAAYNSLFTDKVMPAKPDMDMPVIKAFVRSGESSNKYVDRLYKMSEEAGRTYGTLKAYRDQQLVDDYRKYAKEKQGILAARLQINKGVAQMSKLNKATKAVYAAKDMTPEEKRKRLDELTVQKNELGKQMSDRYWELF